MENTDIYSLILGLNAPWFVEAVGLNTVKGGWTSAHMAMKCA